MEITSVDVDETPPIGLPHDQVAEFLARKKADAWIGTLQDDQVLITADTTVLINDELLNKPEDEVDAFRMLRKLAGNSHRVITGVCFTTRDSVSSFSDESHVTFGDLTDEEIRYYVKTHRPMDKAGAYGVQDWIGYVAVERIEGSFYNVMGLPLHRLYQELRKLSAPH